MPWKNKEDRKTWWKRYYAANADAIKERNLRLYEKKKETLKRQAAEYRKANREKVYEWNGTRRARIRNRVPKWADRQAIKAIYAEARALTLRTGIQHHVDHVIPLLGATVCGLHVHNNLRIITAEENMRKGARFA